MPGLWSGAAGEQRQAALAPGWVLVEAGPGDARLSRPARRGPARGALGPRVGAAGAVREQLEADRPGPARLPWRLRLLPACGHRRQAGEANAELAGGDPAVPR